MVLNPGSSSHPSDDVPARAAGTTPTFDLAVADFLNASSPIRRRPRGAKRAWGHPRGSRLLNPRLRFVRVGDVDALDVRLEVPVAQVAQVKLDDPVPMKVNVQRTVTVKLALPQGVAAAPGMYVRAWIAQPGGGGPSMLTPSIPTNAIAFLGSLPVAFVATGRAVEMRVLRLGDSMGDRTANLTGLRAGVRVIVNRPSDLKSGDSTSGHSQ